MVEERLLGLVPHLPPGISEIYCHPATRQTPALATAMRAVAADPEGRMTRSRNDLTPGIRSFHLRHLRTRTREAKVGSPVHLIYYRVVRSDLIEIVRVLHERMDPIRHLGP